MRKIKWFAHYFEENELCFKYQTSNIMTFDISSKGLTTLKDIEFPPSVTTLYCGSNQLTTLEGCHPSVTTLNCGGNRLATLEGCPPSVVELSCVSNQLTTLEGCPSSVKILYYHDNPLTDQYQNKTLDEIHNINRIK